MALINCPECNKEVSSRAHSCPFCGFPLDEYFEEEAQKKSDKENAEKERIHAIEVEELRKKSLIKTDFILSDSVTVSLDKNEAICAVIDSNYSVMAELIHSNLPNAIFAESRPSDFDVRRFDEFAWELLDEICNPLQELSESILDKYLPKDLETFDELCEIIKENAKQNEIHDFLTEYHRKEYSEYSWNIANAHGKYYDEYTEAGTPAHPIDAVYSDSLVGLVGANISARLINWVSERITSGGVEYGQRKAANNFYDAVERESLIFNTKVINKLDSYVDDIVELYRHFVSIVLTDHEVLFVDHTFEESMKDRCDIESVLEDNNNLNNYKKTQFYNFVKRIPGNIDEYVLAFKSIVFTSKEIKIILNLLDFLSIKENVANVLIGNKNSAACFFADNANIDSLYIEGTKDALTLEGIVFKDAEDKDTYIIDKQNYDEKIKKSNELNDWYRYHIWSSNYEALEELGEPHTDRMKPLYNKALNRYREVKSLIDNDHVRLVESAIKKLEGFTEDISIYQYYDLVPAKQKIFSEFDKLHLLFDDSEMPIALIKGKNNRLLISTARFYYVDMENKSDIIAFNACDIRRVSSVKSEGICFYLFNGVDIYVQLNYYTDDVFKAYFKNFVDALGSEIKKSDKIKDMMFDAIIPKESFDEWTECEIDKRAKLISELTFLKYIFGDNWRKYLALKWTTDFSDTCGSDIEYGIYRFIEAGNVGLEFVVAYDDYSIITDRAFYISSSKFSEISSLSINKSWAEMALKKERWEYSKCSIIAIETTLPEILTKRSIHLLLAQPHKYLEYSNRDISETTYKILNYVVDIERKRYPYINQRIPDEYYYCRECKNYTPFKTAKEVEEITSCPNCGKKHESWKGWMKKSFEYNIQQVLKTDESLDVECRVIKEDYLKHIEEIKKYDNSIRQRNNQIENTTELKNATEKDRIRDLKSRCKEIFEKREQNFVEDHRYKDIERIVGFRKRFKALMSAYYSPVGYDFIYENLEKLSEEALKIYVPRGDYILYDGMDTACPMIITDRVIYVEGKIIDLNILQEVIYYSQIPYTGVQKEKLYTLGFFYDSDVVFLQIPANDDVKKMAGVITTSLKPYLKKGYAPLSETIFFEGYCQVCQSRNIKEGLIKSICNNCNNTDESMLYRSRSRNVNVHKLEEELSKYYDFYESRGVFQDEMEWEKWALSVDISKYITLKANVSLHADDKIPSYDNKASAFPYMNTSTPKRMEPEAKRMFCVFCGKSINRTDKFCTFCGKQNAYGIKNGGSIK